MGTNKPWTLACFLATILLAMNLGSAQDATTADDEAQYLFGFPFCKCSDYRCTTSPYKPIVASEEKLANGQYKVCFRFQDVGCAADNVCCKSILTLMDKIEFQAGAYPVLL